jgi:hypothetical protein
MELQLFDTFERSNKSPMGESEPLFGFYNNSARPEMDNLRNMLEEWYVKFPAQGKADLRARFRSRDNYEHQGAFFELYIHELFLGLGFEMTPHPNLENSKNNPDFLAVRGRFKVLIEATIAAAPQSETAEAQRAESVLDKVNELHSPDFFLDVEIRGAPETQPSSKRLIADLKSWLSGLDRKTIQETYKEHGFQELPIMHWDHDGWFLTFRPLPRNEFTRDKRNFRLIMSRSSEFKSYDPRNSIFNSLHKKSKKYGKLDIPLLICVNALEAMVDPMDIMGALFGAEGIQVGVNVEMKEKCIRFPNGVWRGPTGPKNRSNSAVLAAIRLDPWKVGREFPELYHHPMANHPIPVTELPFGQHIPNEEKTRLKFEPGYSLEEFLQLPESWLN